MIPGGFSSVGNFSALNLGNDLDGSETILYVIPGGSATEGNIHMFVGEQGE
jgi:hypothetical protein